MNPWRLQGWLGHKRIDETMLYVHVAEVHARELPAPVLEAAQGTTDPDARVIAQLGQRSIGRRGLASKSASRLAFRSLSLAPEEGFEFYRCTNDDERLLCIRQLVHRWIPPDHVAFRDVWQQRGSGIATETAPTPLVDGAGLPRPIR